MVDVHEKLLQRVIDGEANEVELQQFETLAAEDPSLMAFLEGSQAVGTLLRDGLTAQAEAVDFSAMWGGIQKEITWHESGRQRSLAAQADAAGLSEEQDVGWSSFISRIFSWPGFAAMGAALVMILVLPSLMDQDNSKLLTPKVDPGPTVLQVAALPDVYSGVEVESVEASDSATVMVFQGGEEGATFIWVSENSPEETAI